MTSLLLKLTPAGDSLLEAIIEEYADENDLDPQSINKAEVVESFLDSLSDKQMFGQAPIEIKDTIFKMGEHITFINGGTA
jgi:hypothetical protein